jgi:hypothetical protein
MSGKHPLNDGRPHWPMIVAGLGCIGVGVYLMTLWRENGELTRRYFRFQLWPYELLGLVSPSPPGPATFFEQFAGVIYAGLFVIMGVLYELFAWGILR